jgi:hypothetical protein
LSENNLAFHAVKFLLANSSDPYAFEINLEKFKHHTGVSCHKLLVKENQQQLLRIEGVIGNLVSALAVSFLRPCNILFATKLLAMSGKPASFCT